MTPTTPTADPILARADDALILGHRLSEWVGHAPTLEEELALANIALDLIGQARLLYQLVATRLGTGITEDDLAYHRNSADFRNLLLVEQPNGDFAHTIVRQSLYSAFAELAWRAATAAPDPHADPDLAAIAAKALPETAYHRRHADAWLIRLGDGTDESHARTQAALDRLWPYAGQMFETDPALQPEWTDTITALLDRATLRRPDTPWHQTGGRAGRHTEYLSRLLAEMQVLPRAHPGATW